MAAYDSEDTLFWNDAMVEAEEDDNNESSLSFIAMNQHLPYAHAVPVSPTYSSVQVAKPINTTYTTYMNSIPIPFINSIYPNTYPLSKYRIKKIHRQKYYDKMYNNSYSRLETLSDDDDDDDYFDDSESEDIKKKKSSRKGSKKKGSKKKGSKKKGKKKR